MFDMLARSLLSESCFMTNNQNNHPEKQISQCLTLIKNILGKDLLGIYLYGSAVFGGLQKYSDIDLFVVINRATTPDEKVKIIAEVLKISGIYMEGSKFPMEITIVNQSDVNPWHYPPHFDFQYGEWLRNKFENGNIEPWQTKEMPDLALLITQVLLTNKILFGPHPNKLLCEIPYRDFILATIHILDSLRADLATDTRNVLLTYARIWHTIETDTICSKPAAADWALDRLPLEYQPVMKRAKVICIGEMHEYWNDLQSLIQPCSGFILKHINTKISIQNGKSIKLNQKKS
jgi:streptomycin 3"-adenylyltransferase